MVNLHYSFYWFCSFHQLTWQWNHRTNLRNFVCIHL